MPVRPLPPARIAPVHGDLGQVVNHLVEAIGTHPASYTPPTRAQCAAMGDIWSAVRGGDLRRASAAATPLGYTVTPFVDDPSGRAVVLLQETPAADGRLARGWGSYILDPRAAHADVTLELPHDFDDLYTGDMGVQTFRELSPGAMLLAGASRFAADADPATKGAADMAHAATSVFDAISQAQTDAVRGSTIVQLHGFSNWKHPEYGSAVVSEGVAASSGSGAAAQIGAALVRAGFDARVFDGSNYPALGAVGNVEGQQVRALGGRLIHVEVSHPVRYDPAQRTSFAAALDAALGSMAPLPG